MAGLFGIFGKKSKPNLRPDIEPAPQESLFFSGANPSANLRDIVKRRVFEGQDLGFGPDYLDKATNPAIQASQRRFQNETVPFIANQASARGLGRSSIATDQMNKAAQEQQSQVDQMVAQFYHLNELQKKSDFGQALELGQNLNTQQERMKQAQAEGSRDLRNQTVGQSRYNDQIDQQRFSTAMGALGPLVTGLGQNMAAGAQSLSPNAQVASVMGRPVTFGQTIQGNPGFFQSFGGNVGKLLGSLGQSMSAPQSRLNIQGGEDQDLLRELIKRGLI